MDPPARLADVIQRPGVYGIRSVDQALVFILGFDAALDGRMLRGFHEWLAVKLGEGDSLAWPVLVDKLIDRLAQKEVQFAGDIESSEASRVNSFLDLLNEFFIPKL